MTLEQLRIFVAVAERGHMTAAAKALGLTQPGASSAIAALEAQYAVKLFDRVGRRIVLSEAGRLFLDEARAVLRRAGAAEQALADLAGLKRGHVTVHASRTVAHYWLPGRLVRFRRAYPAVTLTLKVGNTRAVAAAVGAGQADLGLVEGAFTEEMLVPRRVAEDRLALLVAPGHRWAGGGEPSPDALAAATWVLRETGSGTRAALETALSERGIDPAGLTVLLELAANEAVRAAVEEGAGATLLSRLVAEQSLSHGRLIEVPFAVAPRPFLLLRHAERRMSRAAEALMAVLSEAADDAL